MSTYLYLQCLDHDPPLRAEEESGQHEYDLINIREAIRLREHLVAVSKWADFSYFKSHTVQFLVEHPNCNIGIISEYGVSLPLTEKEES